jgi:hypothetical protein
LLDHSSFEIYPSDFWIELFKEEYRHFRAVKRRCIDRFVDEVEGEKVLWEVVFNHPKYKGAYKMAEISGDLD